MFAWLVRDKADDEHAGKKGEYGTGLGPELDDVDTAYESRCQHDDGPARREPHFTHAPRPPKDEKQRQCEDEQGKEQFRAASVSESNVAWVHGRRQ